MIIKSNIGSVDITVNNAALNRKLNNAQKALNMQILADNQPFIPFQSGALRNAGRFPDGIEGGVIEYDKPYAHYQYVGRVYEDPKYHVAGWYTEGYGWWSRKGVKKIPRDLNSKRSPYLQYHGGGGKEWFEEAKKANKTNWIKLVARELK